MGGVLDWSTTPGSNTTVDGVNIAEGMQAGLVNNAMRAIMALVREWQLDASGVVTAGAGNAYTITSNQGIAAYADGLRFSFRADRNNTGAATLNVDGRGAKALRKTAAGALAALAADDLVAEAVYDVVYDVSSDVFVIVGTHGVAGLTAFGQSLISAADAAAGRVVLDAQQLDPDLTALAGLASNGMIARTGSGTVSARTITAGAGVSVTNGDGVAGNPTISAPQGWTLVSQFYTGTSAATVCIPAFVAGYDYAIRFSWVRGGTNPSTLEFAPFRVVAGTYPTAAAIKGSDSNYFTGWMEILAPMQTADQHHYFLTYAALANNNTIPYFGIVSGNYGPNYASTYGGVNDRISGIRFTRGSGNVSGGTMDLFRRPTNMT